MSRIAAMPATVFFGTGEFAVPILASLIKAGWSVNLVITQPDKPVGRKQILTPPPIKDLATRLGLEIEQPVSLKHFIQNTSLSVVCDYGKLIPAELLKIPKYGSINIHPSLLPKYRGPSPIQSAILNGETETGVSIMLLDEEMDHGPILARIKTKIKIDETAPELEKRLADIGASLLIETLPKYLSGDIKPRPQDHSKATYCKLFSREDGKVDWSKSARQIYNQWRALQPWPGMYTESGIKNQELRIKLTRVRLSGQKAASSILGKFVAINKKELAVACGDGRLLMIDELQPEGKRVMKAEDFINGYLNS